MAVAASKMVERTKTVAPSSLYGLENHTKSRHLYGRGFLER
jgi:hypothetical protein